MSKVNYELSDKTRNGMSQIMVRICISRTQRYRLQSHIFVPRKRFVNGKIIIPRNYLSDYKDAVKAQQALQELSEKLDMLISSPIKEQLTKEKIKKLLDASYEDDSDIFSSPLIMDATIKSMTETSDETTIYSFIDRYCVAKDLAKSRYELNVSLKRHIARFEKFRDIFKLELKGLTYPFQTTQDDIAVFKAFFLEEENLAKKYPSIHKQCVDYSLSLFPYARKGKKFKTTHRTFNYLPSVMKMLSAVYNWIIKNSLAPIDVSIKNECRTYKRIYTDAFYLTKDERNNIDTFDLSGYPKLEIQRDIFIFNCLTGCRYCDLVTLTEENIKDNILQYRPLKTRKQINPVIPKVPLLPRALQLIEKYRGVDKNGKLFPFKHLASYNESIKEIFRIVGITRYVYGSADPTSDHFYNQFCDVATSYTARKTFIGSAYKVLKSPEIISTMSGHAPGSSSFCRYRTIDDEDRKEVIDLLDG